VAISLEQALGHSVRRADLAAAILRALDQLDRDFPREKAAYLERYRADCLTTGHEVRLIQKGETRTAFAESIDDSFALVVRYPDGTREAITAGDVSVRGLLGYV
jgi:BirA family biotin operon repressor/biotin-[acetyl-CoA-carboxylase] ligase